MESVIALIDRAVQLCGSQAALARALGVYPADISDWKKGKRPVTPETVALICDVLQLPGEEARTLAAWAVIENAKNSSKREKLKRAFFGCWVAGVVALAQLMTPSDARASSNVKDYRSFISDSRIYIVVHLCCTASSGFMRLCCAAERGFALLGMLCGAWAKCARSVSKAHEYMTFQNAT